MKSFVNSGLVAVCCLLGGLARGADVPEDNLVSGMTTVEDLRLPFEHYEDGRIRLQLMAGVAVIPADGPVRASEVRLEFYNRSGDLESVLSLDQCEFSRQDSSVRSTSPVRFSRPGLLITGQGCEMLAADKIIRIHDQVKVTLSRDDGDVKRSLPGLGLAPSQSMGKRVEPGKD